MAEPIIIQGGMGAGVSGWRLAQAVSTAGQLGVVAGTALDVIMVRRLQVGDPGGHVRHALDYFPLPDVAQRILDRYYVPGGKPHDRPFRHSPVPGTRSVRQMEQLIVAANFVELFLAQKGHEGPVGVNYLEKIQLPTLPALFGAMLAGVSYVLMGAGIPRAIPGVLDDLAAGRETRLRLTVDGAQPDDDFLTSFDPQEFCRGAMPALTRPKFLAIVSSSTLATVLARKASGAVDGFVVEGATAGGHNAPPRGKMRLDDAGQPIYGDRDRADLAEFRALGLPFWLAGSYARPERVAEALEAGATGVQVGTAFAYCEESDLDPELKRRVLAASRQGKASVFTDPIASPAGFPFKVVDLDGTLSERSLYVRRRRVCDLSFLRHAYRRPDGTLGWRCPAEPEADYVRKGGRLEDTRGRKCLCNALVTNIGLGQPRRGGERERPLITSGDDVADVARFLRPGAQTYHADDVIRHLLPARTRLPAHSPVVPDIPVTVDDRCGT